MPSLVDTNILVYRVDPRDPARQRRATALLEAGIADRSLVLAHQSVMEFVAATSRPRRGKASLPLLPLAEALVEAEQLIAQFDVLYPTRDVLVTAMRGAATYGRVRAMNSFLAATRVHELPALYEG
ncbi:MAG: hypothetical protein KJ040_11550 [Gammaproteobacteria bacterium]|nr:hypothetical protein [Gammaproteobacteria bacterium]